MIEAGTLRKLAPRLYTANMVDSAEVITRRNLFFILENLFVKPNEQSRACSKLCHGEKRCAKANLFPQAVISHRSAFEVSALFEDGNIYLTYNISKTITIPGFTIHLWKGPKADRRDIPMGNLFISGRERRTLEVLQRTRTRLGEGTTKTIPRASVEAFLKNLLLLHGDQALLDFRDSCQEVAAELGMTSEFETLDAIIHPIMTMA